jgi:hypothetical protein
VKMVLYFDLCGWISYPLLTNYREFARGQS